MIKKNKQVRAINLKGAKEKVQYCYCNIEKIINLGLPMILSPYSFAQTWEKFYLHFCKFQ